MLLSSEDALGIKTTNKNIYFLTIVAAVMSTMWSFATIFGALNSLQSHVTTLTNLHGIISLATVLYLRGSVKSEELKVCGLLLLGVVLIMADPWSKRIDLSHATVSPKVADAIMLFSSIPAALFFSINKFLMEGRIVRHLIILNGTIMIISAILATIYDDASFDRNP